MLRLSVYYTNHFENRQLHSDASVLLIENVRFFTNLFEHFLSLQTRFSNHTDLQSKTFGLIFSFIIFIPFYLECAWLAEGRFRLFRDPVYSYFAEESSWIGNSYLLRISWGFLVDRIGECYYDTAQVEFTCLTMETPKLCVKSVQS